MTPRSDDVESLQTYIRHLRHAVVTTSCRETVAALEQMLSEAEARLASSQRWDRSSPESS